MIKIKIVVFSIVVFFSSCVILKRDRSVKNNGIERLDFELPLFLYPNKKNLKQEKLLVFLSGDGGWLKMEDSLSTLFSKNGYYTLGVNLRSYFWKKRKPEEIAKAISMLINKYDFKSKKSKIFLCGYSFGADIVPFIYNRLPLPQKKRVVALEMLSPYSTSAFAVRLPDLINIGSDSYKYKLHTELKKINLPLFCFYGEDENEKPLEGIMKAKFHFATVSGDHHYDEDQYGKLLAVLNRL